MNAPSKAMELKAAISAVLAGMTAFWGWTGWLVIVWLAAMILDYVTGSWAAISAGEWDSAVARAGLWHKLGEHCGHAGCADAGCRVVRNCQLW